MNGNGARRLQADAAGRHIDNRRFPSSARVLVKRYEGGRQIHGEAQARAALRAVRGLYPWQVGFARGSRNRRRARTAIAQHGDEFLTTAGAVLRAGIEATI